MARGKHIAAARLLNREPERVSDLSLLEDFVVTDEPRKNREPGSVRGSPAIGAQRIRLQIEDGAARRSPRSIAVGKRTKHFIKLQIVLIHYHHVTIAVRVRAAFDWCVARHRIRSVITFTRVRSEIDRHHRLRTRDYDIRDTVRHAHVHGPEIRMELHLTAYRRNDLI